jgi:hypothetical protein
LLLAQRDQIVGHRLLRGRTGVSDGPATSFGDRGDGGLDSAGIATVDHHTGATLGELGRDGRTDPA